MNRKFFKLKTIRQETPPEEESISQHPFEEQTNPNYFLYPRQLKPCRMSGFGALESQNDKNQDLLAPFAAEYSDGLNIKFQVRYTV